MIWTLLLYIFRYIWINIALGFFIVCLTLIVGELFLVIRGCVVRGLKISAVMACMGVATMSHADNLLDEVSQTQSEQPHWVTPLITVTPRLEQEFRIDYVHDELPGGSHLNSYGNNKGLELIIPQANVEVALNLPAYMQHQESSKSNGYADSSALIKYRIVSANEEQGNYILTAFMAGSFPTGSAGVSNNAQIYTPTIAAGKGYGPFDIQSTLSYSMPASDEKRIGHQTVWNTAVQMHVAQHFWPELEYNMTHYTDGANDGKTQGFVTTGIVTKWPIKNRLAAVVGLGYQEPVTSFHTYSHALVATARLAF